MDISKAKTITDVNQREVFGDISNAMEYVGKIVTLMGDKQLPLHMFGYHMDGEDVVATDGEAWPTGVDLEGNEQPFDVAVVLLQSKQEVKEGDDTVQRMVPHTILLRPFPTLEQMMAEGPNGLAMVRAVLEKELNHRTVRPLRTADNLQAVLGEVPASIAAFYASGREGGSSILASYNELYATIHDYAKSKVSRIAKARLVKGELKKCLENTAYANCYYPALEEKGDFKLLLTLFIAQAGKKSLSSEIFENWLASRDEQTLADSGNDEEVEDLSEDDLLAGLLADAPEAEAEAPAEDAK